MNTPTDPLEAELDEIFEPMIGDAWKSQIETAKQAIKALIQTREKQVELYYLEELNTVYDDINTGVAKKQSNSTYYINKAIHTATEIRNIKASIKPLSIRSKNNDQL